MGAINLICIQSSLYLAYSSMNISTNGQSLVYGQSLVRLNDACNYNYLSILTYIYRNIYLKQYIKSLPTVKAPGTFKRLNGSCASFDE